MQEAKDPLARYREGLTSRYAEQIDALRDAAGAWEASGLHEPLGPGEWTPHQVVVHVVAAESLAFVPRLKRIASEDHPDLPGWDETAWMEETYNSEDDIQTWLDTFDAARREGLDLIRGLSDDDWGRTSRHPAQGDRTLQWWLEYSVTHADDHLNQLTSTGRGALEQPGESR